MHGTDSFARISASGSIAGQPSMKEMLHSFEEEREVAFKGEAYLVRDNGAVLRRRRPDARCRKLDEHWTFGTLNKASGYLMISAHVVHQITASAFHGPRPSSEHVVNHIDTNRLNNRPDNLCWVTRLENLLLNPITRRWIELAFSSLEAFFENPRANSVPDWDWMCTVTKEQAQESRRRLLEWVEKGQANKGGSLGNWLFEIKPGTSPASEPEYHDTPSFTQAAFQRNWRTPAEFPQCPETVADGALKAHCQATGKSFEDSIDDYA